ncbi:MAG: patatin-like phospholipase family protein [Planctomycetia bacterium]|nr:patatin-like phospholipase family protein [Planctomycetia bacterium]
MRARLAVLALATGLACGGCARVAAVATHEPAPSAADVRARFAAFAEARGTESLQVLVLSGGGQNGAFGVGVLRGWRAAGRPAFDVVTGISTGALQATHAFLGTPADDDALERVYTTTTSDRILCPKAPLAAAFGTSLADFRPLRAFLAELFDDATIDRVAEASKDARRLLLVGTANLATGRMTVWDLGAIAAQRKYDLYRTVLLAAASPPVLAEPVSIGGVLHADGATIGNVFVPNAETHLTGAALERFRALARARHDRGGEGGSTFHVVYNGLVAPAPAPVTLGLLPVATRSLGILVGAAGHGSLWYLYGLMHGRGHAFRYVGIPERMRPEADDPFAFDPVRMRALYDAGVALGRDPSAWASQPPPLEEDLAAPGPPTTAPAVTPSPTR